MSEKELRAYLAADKPEPEPTPIRIPEAAIEAGAKALDRVVWGSKTATILATRVLEAAAPHLRAAWEQPIRELHRPIEIEPSDTICGECSFQLPNGAYFGKVVDWPCPTLALLEGGAE